MDRQKVIHTILVLECILNFNVIFLIVTILINSNLVCITTEKLDFGVSIKYFKIRMQGEGEGM